jgi:hypothetical protein
MIQKRSKQGAAFKPKLARLTPEDIAQAPPVDRRFLAMLTGAEHRNPYMHWAADRERPAIFELPDPLAVELLPMIARSARGWFRPGPDAASLEPITWDTGNAWRFALRIERAADRYRVTGSLERDDVTVPIAERFRARRRSGSSGDAGDHVDASAPFCANSSARARSGCLRGLDTRLVIAEMAWHHRPARVLDRRGAKCTDASPSLHPGTETRAAG